MKKNKKNKFAIYLTTDENYWKHSFVSISSLLKFNNSIDVFLIYFNINDDVLSLFKKNFGEKLTLIKFKQENCNRISCKIKGFYFRYFIPEQLNLYKKILYIDSDTLICGNINKIFDTNLTKTIAAVKEPKPASNKKFYIGKPSKRFNSGVLLINPKKYKSKNYLDKILKQSKNYKDKWGDQPIVNLVFKNDHQYINYKWNCLDKTVSNKKDYKILHFNNFKPWIYSHKSEYTKLYRQYRRKIDPLFFYDNFNIKNFLLKLINP